MHAMPRKMLQPFKSALLLCLMVLSCGMGVFSGQEAESPISIAELKKLCGLPVPCSATIGWEGRKAAVYGFVDGVNVFDKGRTLLSTITFP